MSYCNIITRVGKVDRGLKAFRFDSSKTKEKNKKKKTCFRKRKFYNIPYVVFNPYYNLTL